jgi:hypothetical protein
MKLLAFLSLVTIGALSSSASAAPTAPGVVVPITCSGPSVIQGRKVAASNKLALGQSLGACFGQMQIYAGPDRQIVVVAPSKGCPGGKALDVYGGSRAGPWHAYFAKPVCGSRLQIGPKNQWGDWMLTVDGQHYDSRGEFYVRVP